MFKTIDINLSGRFRVSTCGGLDLTPRSAKGQGLLCLLATQPDLERGRSWLQDKLWSDRAQETGAGSLRQELAQIRKRFGPYASILKADRQKVFLDGDQVNVVDTCIEDDTEFLEGIDVKDQEFSHWLSVERSARDSRRNLNSGSTNSEMTRWLAKQTQRSVIFVGDSNTPIDLKVFEKHFSDGVARSIREFTDVKVFSKLPNAIEPGQLIVSTQAFRDDRKTASLSISIEDLFEKGVLFSETVHKIDTQIPIDQNPPSLQLISKVSDAIAAAYFDDTSGANRDRDATMLSQLALRKIFSIDRDELISADEMLKEAYEIDPRGVYQAWRAQLLTIQYVERYQPNTQELVERCEACCMNALAADPTNSNVLAAVANARTILDKNFVAGGELAILSVKANPANPLSWWALSNAKQYEGEYEIAYAAAVRAQQLAVGTRVEFWTNFQRSLTAAMTQRHQEALRMGEISSALAPKFRPPLRYLTSLYANNGKLADAKRVTRQLKVIEKDFSIDRLINDADYPVSIMRKSGLIDEEKLKEVVW